MAIKVFIDVGHGGSDAGAVNKELVEKNMNLVTAKAVAATLGHFGVTTKMSRTDDRYLSLTQRAKLANDWDADYFISCHYNAGGGDRGEVIHRVAYDAGLLMARTIATKLMDLGQSQLKQYSKPSSSGKGDYYTIIAATKMPAIIIEPCFIDNALDRQFADTYEEQMAIGVAIAEGIMDFLGINYKEVEEMIYNYIDENMPAWARPTIKKLVDKGYLKGNEKGELGLNETMLKIFVINDRAGLYDIK